MSWEKPLGWSTENQDGVWHMMMTGDRQTSGHVLGAVEANGKQEAESENDLNKYGFKRCSIFFF